MAYKRYFKRNGKTFGPYYYESYRDENGDVKKRYIGKVEPEKKKISVGKLVLGGLVLFSVVAIVLVSVQISGDGIFSFGGEELSNVVGSVKGFASNSVSRIVGFVVEGSQLEVTGGSASQDGSQPLAEGSSQSPIVDGSSQGDGDLVSEEVEEGSVDAGLLGGVEEIDEGEIVEVEENGSQIGTNDTDLNESVDVGDGVDEGGNVEGNITEGLNESGVSEGVENVTEGDGELVVDDGTDGNVSEVVNVSEKIDVLVRQYRAVVGRRVKWVKKVVVNKSGNVSVEIPLKAEDVVIKTGEEVDEAEAEVDEYDDLVNKVDRGDIADGSITGFVAKDIRSGKGILTRVWEWVIGFTISGNVIDEIELEESGDIVESGDVKIVDLSEVVEGELAKGGEAKVSVEYYTEAPVANEIEIDRGKRVVVSGDDALNYSDILAYSILDNKVRVNSSRLKVVWLKEVEVVSEKEVKEEVKEVKKEVKEDEKEDGDDEKNKTKEDKIKGNKTDVVVENLTEGDGGILNMDDTDSEGVVVEKGENETQIDADSGEEVVEDVEENVVEEVVEEVVVDDVVGETKQDKEDKGNKEDKGEGDKGDKGKDKGEASQDGGDLDLVGITGGAILGGREKEVGGSEEVVAEVVRVEVDYVGYDLDGDGFVDYVEWVVPHLSNQTYEIIYISGAEHLDENRTFVEDIYDDVSAKDDNWSKVIPDGEYVRVSFEKELDASKDITIFARGNRELVIGNSTSVNGSVSVNGTEVPYDVYLKKKRIDEIRREMG